MIGLMANKLAITVTPIQISYILGSFEVFIQIIGTSSVSKF